MVQQRRGGLPNKGRYRCAVSAKPRPGKISPKNLMPGQQDAQKPNDQASFHELSSAKIGNFQQIGHFFQSFIKYMYYIKIAKKPGQNLLLKT